MPAAQLCFFTHYKDQGCTPTVSTSKPKSQQQHLEASGEDFCTLKPLRSELFRTAGSRIVRAMPSSYISGWQHPLPQAPCGIYIVEFELIIFIMH